ncbi:MAG: DNA primase, partial [Pseudomonadota bacterium]|nr:DNA primase [Pseudomonadota bacterium]
MIHSKNSVNEFLNEINIKVRLSDFIGQYVQLVERGNSYVGKCPFHNEKTPSFNVNNDKALFYCFGCKTGGNIINFITKFNNLSFKEAIDFLSKYSGINSTFDFKKSSENSEESILYKILKESNAFFQDSLKKTRVAYEYVREREISDLAIKDFNIGFCPDEKKLIRFLESKGFDPEQIKKTDLLIKNKNDQYFGRFSNRITFPIFNFNNFIVGFGGRTIQNSKIKYINSQENLIFKKSQVLFGLFQNFSNIRSNKEIILVEGYMDVIKLYESNIKQAVSSLGTTLSETQIKKMWNFSDIPYICFDGDEAGLDSSKKIAVKLLKFLVPGKSVKFIVLPEKIDPDLFMKENTKDDFVNLKKEARDLSDVIWNTIIDSVETHTPEFFASIDQKINDLTKKIDNKNISKEYYKFLSSRKDQFIWEKNRIFI